MIEYTSGDHKYTISYSDLREHYYRFVKMSNAEFMKNLPSAIHFACVVCWFKEVGLEASLSDRGVVHQLAHMLEFGNTLATEPLKEIRANFKRILYLS